MAEFKVIEAGAFADYEFEAKAESIEQLFEICAMAVFDVITDLSKVSPDDQFEFEIEAENTEELLFVFLAELIYLKDVETILFCKYDIHIDGGSKLSCRVQGEHINPEKHELKTDVKAVTYHHFELKQTKDGYSAHIILDL